MPRGNTVRSPCLRRRRRVAFVSGVVGDRDPCRRRRHKGWLLVGTLDERMGSREALEEARDNAGFAEATDGDVTSLLLTGSNPPELELWDERLEAARRPSPRRLALRAFGGWWRPSHPRGGECRLRRSCCTSSAIASSTGISAVSRRTSCFLSTHAVAGDRDDTQTGWGYADQSNQ